MQDKNKVMPEETKTAAENVKAVMGSGVGGAGSVPKDVPKENVPVVGVNQDESPLKGPGVPSLDEPTLPGIPGAEPETTPQTDDTLPDDEDVSKPLELMGFEDALLELKAGNKVSRMAWVAAHSYIYLDNNEFKASVVSVWLDPANILAEDWYVSVE